MTLNFQGPTRAMDDGWMDEWRTPAATARGEPIVRVFLPSESRVCVMHGKLSCYVVKSLGKLRRYLQFS